MSPDRTLPPGTFSFGRSPDRILPLAHSRLVADAADTRVSFRNQVPASANSRGSFLSGFIKHAEIAYGWRNGSTA